LKEDILNLILQAENEYHITVKDAVTTAEKYADECKEEQDIYRKNIKHEWQLFKKAENDRLEKALCEDEQKKKAETAELKERLRVCQQKKADLISERLKREVLSLYGYS